jgi:hypothetical protein
MQPDAAAIDKNVVAEGYLLIVMEVIWMEQLLS